MRNACDNLTNEEIKILKSELSFVIQRKKLNIDEMKEEKKYKNSIPYYENKVQILISIKNKIKEDLKWNTISRYR